jgi:hypothetical protein
MRETLESLYNSDRSFPEDYKLENGNYMCICIYCKLQFIGYKRKFVCKKCEKLMIGNIHENNDVQALKNLGVKLEKIK